MDELTQMRWPQTGPLRAGSFIVTLFGDIVAPRGGEVGIRDIITFCAPLGLSETLIRTAMSRLVAAGQVRGLRQGRRSFYALTEAARIEYAQAGDVIYGTPSVSEWRFLCFPEGGATQQVAALAEPGFVVISDMFALGPARGACPVGAVAFAARPEGSIAGLRAMVAQLWPLDGLAKSYEGFLTFSRQIAKTDCPSPAAALALRVILVHTYREIALRDPQLVPEALPEHWPGHAARKEFARLYLHLSPDADSAVGTMFAAASGPLARVTPQTRARYDTLRNLVSA